MSYDGTQTFSQLRLTIDQLEADNMRLNLELEKANARLSDIRAAFSQMEIEKSELHAENSQQQKCINELHEAVTSMVLHSETLSETLAPQANPMATHVAPLTFQELRLATMLHMNKGAACCMRTGAGLTSELAALVISLDRIAAANNIDLAAAIRQRFEPDAKDD
jgi:chromosome segregation ATPase